MFWERKIEMNRISSCDRITIVSHPFYAKVSGVFYSTLIKILESISNEIFIITGNFHPEHTSYKLHIENVHPVKENQSWLAKIIEYVWAYFTICRKLAGTRPHTVIFVQGSSVLALPLLFSKLLKSKVILIVTVSNNRIATHTYKGLLLSAVNSTISNILLDLSCTFSNKIVVLSESLISYFGLEKYKGKISCCKYWFLSDAFRAREDFYIRRNIVGLVGRLNREKGCLEFVKAIPLILSKKKDARFLVVGEGPLENEMKEELEKAGCTDKVEFVGAVPNEEVADYFNQMKFHILPSHTEAASATIFEAMACGTIVIANSIGGVPDFVVDGQTGFLLDNNLPGTIASKIIDLWEHPDLDKIRKNALLLVKREFSYKKAVEDCRNLLKN